MGDDSHARDDGHEPGGSDGSTPRLARRFVVRATTVAAVAVLASLSAVALRLVFSRAFALAHGARDVVSMFEQLPAFARLTLPAVGGGLAGLVSLVAARTARDQGVGDVMEAVAGRSKRLSMRATLLKSLGAALAILSGGSIGREGPLIQLGASLGALVARLSRVEPVRLRALVAAGAAAGFAAAYNTPLAAVLFVIEIVLGVVSLDIVLDVSIAVVLATALTRTLLGAGPIYGSRAFDLVSGRELAAYALLGVAAAFAAQAFMRGLSAAEHAFRRLPLGQPWRGALGGLLVGAIAVWIPQVTGNGYEPLNAMLDGPVPLVMALTLFVAKMAATTSSVSSGSPGGVFTPTLFLGAALGVALHHVLAMVTGLAWIGGAGGYALVGMAAMSAATTHAPLMAAVLVFELSGDYAIVLPLLLATSVATWLSRAMRSDSIYDAERRKRSASPEAPPRRSGSDADSTPR